MHIMFISLWGFFPHELKGLLIRALNKEMVLYKSPVPPKVFPRFRLVKVEYTNVFIFVNPGRI